MLLFCLVFVMSFCGSVYMCFVVTCWERADLLALVCGVFCDRVPTVREKSVKNEKSSRSGKSQGILI